jgi:transcriptional regulator with PAS, ATPase and Fis domain
MSSVHEPSEFVDKQLKIVMKNNRLMLDYMEQSSRLLENAVLSFSKQFNEKTVESIKKSTTELFEKQKTVTAKMKKKANSSESKQTAKITSNLINHPFKIKLSLRPQKPGGLHLRKIYLLPRM